jgi:hypothetical protein
MHDGAPGGMATVVSYHARVTMLPLDRAEYADKDDGVRDGVANCDACARGHQPCSTLP